MFGIYTFEMSKSVWDKAFFMDKIPGVKCVIDFGCADGAMIRYLAPLFPDIYFIGYDICTYLPMYEPRISIKRVKVTVYYDSDAYVIDLQLYT